MLRVGDVISKVAGNTCCRTHGMGPSGMAEIEKLDVVLTPEIAAELRAAVEGGEYGSVSEVVRDALHDWRRRRKIEALETEELRRLVQEGIESGPGLDAGPVFARLHAQFTLQASKGLPVVE